MYKLSAKITINSEKTWTFSTISSCEITRDIQQVTSTCTLVLPKKVKWQGADAVPVKHGDRITVQLGYGDKPETVFTGYIKSVGAKTPIEIACEDEMFLLKQTPAKKKSYANADLATLLAEQLPSGTKFEVFAKQEFGKYVVKSDTVSQLLGDLAGNGFSFFFKNGVLQAGMLHSREEQIGGAKQKFVEQGNIIDSDGLECRKAEAVRLRIKASGTDKAGKKISVEVGDKDGELRSYFKYNTTKAELEAEAKKRLADWKTSGLSGSFTTFGFKPVGLLDIVKVELPDVPSKTYKVVKTVLTFGKDGYRQEITI